MEQDEGGFHPIGPESHSSRKCHHNLRPLPPPFILCMTQAFKARIFIPFSRDAAGPILHVYIREVTFSHSTGMFRNRSIPHTRTPYFQQIRYPTCLDENRGDGVKV